MLIAAVAMLTAGAVACGTSSPPPVRPPAPAAIVAAPAAETPTPAPMAEVSPPASPAPVTTPMTVKETASYDVDGLSARALDFLTAFTNEFSPRASGTQQERAAAEFLSGRFEALGYDVRLQDFTFDVLGTSAALSFGEDEAAEVMTIRMALSGEGAAAGPLTRVGRAFSEDIPAGGLDGKIALIERGDISFEEKVRRVAEAGAVGAIVYNNVPGLFGGTLVTESSIPVVSASMESGQEMLGLIEENDVQAVVSVLAERIHSQNVIAEMAGSDGRVVVLGGHYDTVPNVPGANDNGSGVASLVTTAEEIASAAYPFTIRIIAFGAEELGLHGSERYVGSLSESDRASITAMLNYDALAGSSALNVTGDPDLQDTVIHSAKEAGVSVREQPPSENFGSDHTPFLNAGIPAVFFMDGEFSRIHTPEDRLEFINEDLLGQSVAASLALLDHLAAR